MKNTRTTMRLLHRYIGYFMAGIMAVYAISGVLLIYRDTDFLKKEKISLTKESMGIKSHLELQILNKKNIEKRKIAEQYYNELWENKLLVYLNNNLYN